MDLHSEEEEEEEDDEEEECDEECRDMCLSLGDGWGQTRCLKYCGCAEKQGKEPTSEYDGRGEECSGDKETIDRKRTHKVSEPVDPSYLPQAAILPNHECYLSCVDKCLGRLNMCLEKCLDASCGGYRPGSTPVSRAGFTSWFILVMVCGGLVGGVAYAIAFSTEKKQKHPSDYTLIT